jgi:hypothetical protein
MPLRWAMLPPEEDNLREATTEYVAQVPQVGFKTCWIHESKPCCRHTANLPPASGQLHLEVQVLPRRLREQELEIGLRLLHTPAVSEAPALRQALWEQEGGAARSNPLATQAADRVS